MNNVIRDKYALGQSQNKSITKNAEEIRLDLDLRIDYKNKIGAIIQGTVTDSYGLPISAALVKLMTEDYNPIIQTSTGEDGSYSLAKVPLNLNMKIYADATGKMLQDGILISPKTVELIIINFVLEEDPSSKFGIIAGDVFDSSSKDPINEAMVYLYYVQSSTDNIIQSAIFTNENGQFVFRDVPLGQYLITVSSKKYKVFNISVSLTSNSEIIPLDVPLEKLPSLYSGGIISGVIKDKNGDIVQNADIVLYQVQIDDLDIPVDFTTTTVEGVYYFNNIPKGSYKIKCTEIKLIDSDQPVIQQGMLSPNFYKFEISESSSDFSLEVNALDGNFSNSSYISNLNGFAQGIGGPNNVFIETTINAPINGIYKMAIQYVSANSTGNLKFNVNGEISSNVMILSITNSWNSVDAKVFYIMVNLLEGDNTIRFYNDTGEYAPAIGQITFNLYSKTYEVNALEGVLGGGASITNSQGVNFVTGLGINTNNFGYVEVSVNASVRRTYNFNIQYLAGDQDTTLQVDVNKKQLGQYTLSKTNNWTLNYSKIYTLTINLEEGKNIIRLYNNINSIAPWIGNLSYNAQLINGVTSATLGTMSGGAILVLNNTMVGNLGGVGNGKVIIELDISIAGQYMLFVQCVSNLDGGSPLSIEINHIETISFVVAETGANSINDSVNYVISCNFFSGVNDVIFYNLSNTASAYIGNIQWVLIEPFVVNTPSKNGIKYNGATFTWNANAIGLGGSNRGVLKLPVEVYSYGQYNCSFKYLTNNQGGAPIKLYGNNELIGSYVLPQTNYNNINDAKIATVIANFDGTSDDVLSFYNFTGIRSLDIGNVSFEKFISFKNVFFAKDIEVFDGAVISDELILGIGEGAGMINFSVNVPETEKYDLAIYYLAEDNNKISNISVNWVDLPQTISFEQTNSMDIADAKVKVITLDLFEGNNIIKIYNNT